MITFEQTGWQRISLDSPAMDAVERDLKSAGVQVRDLDISTVALEFAQFVKQPAYQGEYKTYGGTADHCLLEKALEHFLSFKFLAPRPSMTAVDIGSCKSVVPQILREQFGCTCYEQDLDYPAGVHAHRIGSSADKIPLPDASVDFFTLHCTFEHFEGSADTGFVRECARLLRPGGKALILPLYINPNYVNVTGEASDRRRNAITFDQEASYHCVIPEWNNRFGRHYSPPSLLHRVLTPARDLGLSAICYRAHNWQSVDPNLWIRWILMLGR
jgi:SAM-dependent methyltransferase